MKFVVRSPWFLPWTALFALSLVLHLWGLTDRPFHSDEAIHAKLSLELATRGSYDYDPTYHGPLLYFITAFFFLLLGDSDFVARLPVALLGVAFLFLAWRLRRPLGVKAAWFTGLLFTVSPVCLYYGRFLAMDMLEMFTASACLLCMYEAHRDGRPRLWIWAGFWAALAFATKENAFVTVFLAAVTWMLVAFAYRWSIRPAALLAAARPLVVPLACAVSLFTIVTLTLYTFFLRQPEDWRFAIDAVRYWAGQHYIERIGGPWWYHLFRLGVYEFLVLGAALAWIARRRHLRPLEMTLLCFGLASIAMYAYLGEKTPWLAVHQLWAFFPLAGAQLARTFGRRGRWWSRAVSTLALVATMVVTIKAVYLHEREYPLGPSVEALHYSTTVDGFEAVIAASALLDRAERRYAVVSGIATWPLRWYWRDVPVRWGEPLPDRPPTVAVVDLDMADRLIAELGGDYTYREVPMRLWWHAHASTPSITNLLRYLLWREPWAEPRLRSVILALRDPRVSVDPGE